MDNENLQPEDLVEIQERLAQDPEMLQQLLLGLTSEDLNFGLEMLEEINEESQVQRENIPQPAAMEENKDEKPLEDLAPLLAMHDIDSISKLLALANPTDLGIGQNENQSQNLDEEQTKLLLSLLSQAQAGQADVTNQNDFVTNEEQSQQSGQLNPNFNALTEIIAQLSQTANQDSKSGSISRTEPNQNDFSYSNPQRYPSNSNSNSHFRGNFNRSNYQHKEETPRYQSKNNPHGYEEKMNSENNSWSQRQNFNYNNSNNFSRFGPNNYRKPYNNNYSHTNNNNNNGNYNNYNNRQQNNRGRPNVYQPRASSDSYHRTSYDGEKFLDTPLNELANGTKSKPGGRASAILERSRSTTSRDPKLNPLQEDVSPFSHEMYSDKLGLKEKYTSNEDTPTKKGLKKALEVAERSKVAIFSCIDTMEANLQKWKTNFFSLQPDVDSNNLDEYIDKLLNDKEKGNESTIIKKSIRKLSIMKSKYKRLQKGRDEDIFQSVHCYEEPKIYVKPTSEQILLRTRNELGFTPDPDQLSSIEKILNDESCIYRYISGYEKSVIFTSLSLLSKGLIIYIHPSPTYLLNIHQSLPKSVVGGCLSNLVKRDKITEILQTARAGKLKILFSTPEKFTAEGLLDLKNISAICLDEAQCFPDISPNFRVNYSNFAKFIFKQATPILTLVSPITHPVKESLLRFSNLPHQSIYSQDYSTNIGYDITMTRDEDKLRSLINLFKIAKYKDKGHSIVIYTECKKSIEDLSNQLNNNGIKATAFHNGKTELYKLEAVNNIIKNKEGIIVTNSNTDLGMDKSNIDCVIHYSLPRNLELYIQEISGLNDGAVCHLFLHDEDYFSARKSIQSDIVEKEQINHLIMKVFDVFQTKEEDASAINDESKVKKDRIIKIKSDILSPKESLNQQNAESSNQFSYTKESRDKMEIESEDYLVLRVDESCCSIDLKKELLSHILTSFEEETEWLEYYGIVPLVCTVKILSEKKIGEIMSKQHNLVKSMMEKNNKESGLYKINIPETAVELSCTAQDVMRSLKSLQDDSLIHHEVTDEAFCFKLSFQPHQAKVKEAVEKIFNKMQKRVTEKTKKLDLVYAVCKTYSFQSIEHIHKQNKFDNERLLKSPNTPSQTATELLSTPPSTSDKTVPYVDSYDKKKPKPSLIEIFSKYLNYKDGEYKDFEHLLDSKDEMRDLIPLGKLSLQREKSSALTEAQEVATELLTEFTAPDYISQLEFMDVSQISSTLSRDATRILMGFPIYTSKKDWKTYKSWERFSHYDYYELLNVVSEGIANFLIFKGVTSTDMN